MSLLLLPESHANTPYELSIAIRSIEVPEVTGQHELSIHYRMEYWNPNSEVVYLFDAGNVPDFSMNVTLDDPSLDLQLQVIQRPGITPMEIKSGITVEEGNATIIGNDTFSEVPLGAYWFTPNDHCYAKTFDSSTTCPVYNVDTFAYLITVQPGVYGFGPPHLPDDWGEVLYGQSTQFPISVNWILVPVALSVMSILYKRINSKKTCI